MTCGECNQPIETGVRDYDSGDYATKVFYYSCREKGCTFHVCRSCANKGIRHPHREFCDNTPTLMMTTLHGRAGYIVEEDDDDWLPMASSCLRCEKPATAKQCRQCKAMYCSVECYKKHWNEHRLVCRKPK